MTMKNNLIKCYKCGEMKSLEEFHNHKTIDNGKLRRCKKCIEEVSKTYYERRGRKLTGKVSMYENKSCPAYLGIVVGERLCRHLFNDVEVMPPQNPGYDIICNRGKKIDVKTSCLIIKHPCPHWHFQFNKNTTADYFICVAFDNRKNLNPLHMWMIPGDEVNEKTGVSITPSKVHKWDEWRKDINAAQLCCTTMKEC